MAQGRVSAVEKWATIVGMLICCMVVVQLEYVEAANFVVGDTGGWTFNLDSWPKGKRFRAGDLLKFNYDPTIHNVVAVDKSGYTNCRSPTGAKVFKSGKDQVKLAKGLNYFICSTAGHCESGMKIAVNAL